MSQTLKRNSFIIMLAALLALVGVSTSLAAEPTGSSPDEGLSAGRSHTLQAGESVWYAFEYDVEYEEVENNDGDNVYQLDPSKVSIWLVSEPEGARTNFEVWTPERLRQWQVQKDGDDEVQPVGRGSEDDNTPGDYFWAGEFYESGTYYVKVTNESHAASYYTLYIEGKNVKPTTKQAEMSMQSEEAHAEAPAESKKPSESETTEEKPAPAKEEVAAQGGTRPDNALTPRGQWMALEPGESVWYALEYSALYEEVENDDGDKEYRIDPSQVSIWLDSESGQGGTNFEVWTPELLRQWQMQQDGDDEVTPVGRGSEDDNTPGDYFWSGTFYESGTYYVKVTNESFQKSYHTLNIKIVE